MSLLSFIFSNDSRENPNESSSLPEDKSASRKCPDVNLVINYGLGILMPDTERYSEIEEHVQICRVCSEIAETARKDLTSY